jgi:Mrp family chromosome partitioning ATPase
LAVHDTAEKAAISAVEDVPNLWLVTSGPIPPNPSELLGSGRVKELISGFKNEFAYVILDTPPVNAVTDAAILAAAADGTILVVEQGRTTFPGLRHAKLLLDRVGAHTVGVVMNKVRASGGSYSYQYEYGNYGAAPDGSTDEVSQSLSASAIDEQQETINSSPSTSDAQIAAGSASEPPPDLAHDPHRHSASHERTAPLSQPPSEPRLDEQNGSSRSHSESDSPIDKGTESESLSPPESESDDQTRSEPKSQSGGSLGDSTPLSKARAPRRRARPSDPSPEVS